MSQRNAILGLVAICLVVILLSFGGLVWDFVTHLELNIDGLLLLLICLMMGGVFTLMLAMLAKEAGWLPQRAAKPTAEAKAPAAAPAKSTAPASPPTAPATNPGKPGIEQGK